MIQDLPLLPAEWVGWDWTISNGTATAEQTQIAYNAVLNQGQCALFSRLVWNDIVDCLATALEVSGIGWNNKYCSAEDCKINVQYGELTAMAFNSVRYNIDRFGIVHWTWAYIEKDGYIGRKDVRGFENYGSLSDKVYGWYLIELTKRLNTLLDVLKDVADLSNMEHVLQQNSYMDVKFGRIKTAPVGYLKQIHAIYDGKAERIKVQPIDYIKSGLTYGIYEGKRALSKPVEHFIQAVAPYSVEPDRIQTISVRHISQQESACDTKLDKITMCSVLHASGSQMRHFADLRDMV